jgi:nucleoside-diphosphate-sugar epimerase
MRKVAVTGGAGRLGKYIVEDFLQHGWAVLSIDVVPEGATTTNADAEIVYALDPATARLIAWAYRSRELFGFGSVPAVWPLLYVKIVVAGRDRYTSIMADLTDPGQAYAALAGCDAVVHMAAWANAGVVTDPRTFNDNTSALFNVLQAAAGVLKAVRSLYLHRNSGASSGLNTAPWVGACCRPGHQTSHKCLEQPALRLCWCTTCIRPR